MKLKQRLRRTTLKQIQKRNPIAAQYITATVSKRFSGGFFFTMWGGDVLYAKTKTGIIYKFPLRYRVWVKVSA